MNIEFDILVMLPELILAIGAMVLLLAGAIGGEKTAPVISWAAILLLAASGVAVVLGNPGPASLFEAVAANTPLVLDAAAAMPQEIPNADLAAMHGLAVKVEHRQQLGATVAAMAAGNSRPNRSRAGASHCFRRPATSVPK